MLSRSLRLVRSKTGRPPRKAQKHRRYLELTFARQMIVLGSTWVVWDSALNVISVVFGDGNINPLNFDPDFTLWFSNIPLTILAVAILLPAYRGLMYLIHRLYDALGWTRYVPRRSDDDHATA